MTALALCVILLSIACQVGGQIFFKKAMDRTHAVGGFAHSLPMLAAGIGAMGLSFFLWLGLLSKFPLSSIYPFEGIERVFLVCAAAIFLGERITVRLGLGVLLICAGIVLVSGS